MTSVRCSSLSVCSFYHSTNSIIQQIFLIYTLSHSCFPYPFCPLPTWPSTQFDFCPNCKMTTCSCTSFICRRPLAQVNQGDFLLSGFEYKPWAFSKREWARQDEYGVIATHITSSNSHVPVPRASTQICIAKSIPQHAHS